MKTWGIIALAVGLGLPGIALAQQETLTSEPAPAAGTPAWRTLSRTSSTIYLVDSGSVRDADGAKSVLMARTLRSPSAAGEREHAVETYQIRCDAGQWRVVRTEEYGPDGAEVDAWDEADSAWLDVPANSNMAYLKAVACDGELPNGRAWPSLDAFMASPRT